MDETEPTEKGWEKFVVKGFALDVKPPKGAKERTLERIAREGISRGEEEPMLDDSLIAGEPIDPPDELRDSIINTVAQASQAHSTGNEATKIESGEA